MNLLLKTVINKLISQPAKSIITIISATLGVLVITVCINMNFKLSALILKNSKNHYVMVMSGKKTESNSETFDYPPYNDTILENITMDFPEVTNFSVVNWIGESFIYGEDLYNVNSAIASKRDILDIYGIDIVAGQNFINDEDPQVMISSENAEILFGTTDCIGEVINLKMDGWMDGKQSITLKPYTITGVYETLHQVKRLKHGIPDIIYNLEASSGIEYLLLSVDSRDIDKTMKNLDSYLKGELGEDKSFIIWNGHLTNHWQDYEWMDEIVNIIKIFFSILAGVALIIVSFSLFSMIMISVTERGRDIGLLRSLGGTKIDVLKQFITESIVVIFIGVIPGLILANIFFPVILDSTLPAITGGDLDFSGMVSSSIELPAILISVGVTMFAGSLLGMFPAVTALKSHPIENIREG